MKEFDAEYFARTMRKVHLLLATQMDDSERFVANYQQCNAIRLDGSSSSSDNEDDNPDKQYMKIPRVNSKMKKKEIHSRKVMKFLVLSMYSLFRKITTKSNSLRKTTS